MPATCESEDWISRSRRSFSTAPRWSANDTRRDYGERRVIAIGFAQGLALTVVYTDRAGTGGGVVRRIISARLSNRREREAYFEALEQE